MTLKDEVESQLLKRLKPKEEPLLGRHYSLPHKGIAFIYQRQSSYEQKVQHIWSQKEQDDLVILAQRDGYPDELIYVEKRDLGISGRKTDKGRPGLAYLILLVKEDKVESLWVVEVSRIYRDLDYVNADELALLLREHKVIVCTPRRKYNLTNQDDWEDFHDEMADVVKDTRYRTEKFSRTRMAKARCGLWCGTPVPAGYIVKKGDRDSYDIIESYQPHAFVIDKIFDAYIAVGRSSKEAARTLIGVEFPFFPEELKHMATRTSLRRSPKTATGYTIIPSLIHSIVSNPFYIGWWSYGGELISKHHHEVFIEESNFYQACKLPMAEGKRRGKAINFERLPLDGLLWDANHEVERRIAAHSAAGRYICDYDYQQGLSDHICLSINHRFLDTPIIGEVFRALKASRLLLEFKDDVVESLREEVTQSKLQERRLRADIRDLQQRIETYKWQLGETRDPQRVETYWEQIRSSQEQISLKERQLSEVQKEELNKEDVISVIKFLEHFRDGWDKQSYGLQNQFLRQLLDKIVVRHNHAEIAVTIYWHTGMQQELWIKRPRVNSGRDKNWTAEEGILLKELWPSMSKEIIMAALLGRSWMSISLKAHRLGLTRIKVRDIISDKWRPWTPEEDEELVSSYGVGVPLEEIAKKLGRTKDAVECRASLKKIRRPTAMRFKAKEVEWEDLDERLGRLEPQKFIDDKSECRGR